MALNMINLGRATTDLHTWMRTVGAGMTDTPRRILTAIVIYVSYNLPSMWEARGEHNIPMYHT